MNEWFSAGSPFRRLRRVEAADDDLLEIDESHDDGLTWDSWSTQPVPVSSVLGCRPDVGADLSYDILGIAATEWNTEVLVEFGGALELWRVAPSRIRKVHPLFFSPGVPLWGAFGLSNGRASLSSGFQLFARDDARYDVQVDVATGRPEPRVLRPRPLGRSLGPGQVGHRQEFDVFVSYKRSESAGLAVALRDELRARQVRVWFDTDHAGLIRNKLYTEAIRRGIRTSHAFVVLFSDGSLAADAAASHAGTKLVRKSHAAPQIDDVDRFDQAEEIAWIGEEIFADHDTQREEHPAFPCWLLDGSIDEAQLPFAFRRSQIYRPELGKVADLADTIVASLSREPLVSSR